MLRLKYPGGGPSPVVAQSETPGSNVLRFSTVGGATFMLDMFPASGGVLTGTFPAPIVADSLNFSAFLDPTAHACTGLAASQSCTIGQVGLVAGATITGSVNPLVISIPKVAAPSALNYQGLWWASPPGVESGWGINFAHQGNIIFATWFTYDTNGKAWWLSMTADKTGDEVYSGKLYQTKGPAFNAVPFDPRAVTPTEVGNATLTFNSATRATFAYNVAGGAAQTKTITRQVFGPLPTCVWGVQTNLAAATNYQDLWWASPAGSESGWGINFTHQGTTIFATWFTYDCRTKPSLVLSDRAANRAAHVFRHVVPDGRPGLQCGSVRSAQCTSNSGRLGHVDIHRRQHGDVCLPGE